jgi:signal transduction histidine kinase
MSQIQPEDLPPALDQRRYEALLAEHKRVESALLERVKELNCLYGVSRLAQRQDMPLADLATQIAALICASWQYPEIACASIRIDGRLYATSDYRPSPLRQAHPIVAQGEPVGEVEVCYLEQRPECDEGPFLKEERHLITAVAELLGRIVERRRVEEQMRALSSELIMAQENERRRIASELHDHLTQDLVLTKLDLEQARQSSEQNPALRQKLESVAERLSEAINSIRDLAYGLLPLGLTELGLVECVLNYCSEFSLRYGLEVEVFADGMDKLVLDFDTQINLYRLIQEALANARKHAKAAKVVIRLIGSYPSVLLRIEDDGRGVDMGKCLAKAGREKRMGMWSMRERVRLLDGKITFRSKPGAGMRILVEAPCTRRGSAGEQKTNNHR